MKFEILVENILWKTVKKLAESFVIIENIEKMKMNF